GMGRSPVTSLKKLRNPLCCRLTPKKRLRVRVFRRKAGHVPARDSELVERGSVDAKAGGFQAGDDILDRLRIARLALDLDHRVLGGKAGEDSAVVTLEHVDACFVAFG